MGGRVPEIALYQDVPALLLGAPSLSSVQLWAPLPPSSLPWLPVQRRKDSKHALTLARDQVEGSGRHAWVLGPRFTYHSPGHTGPERGSLSMANWEC